MSEILIRGVVMPLTCEECPCYDNNDYSCNVTGCSVKEYRFDGRPDNCPIVEVPTPHGRLIDAEAINYPLGWQGEIVKAVINKALTIIEAEANK